MQQDILLGNIKLARFSNPCYNLLPILFGILLCLTYYFYNITKISLYEDYNDVL